MFQQSKPKSFKGGLGKILGYLKPFRARIIVVMIISMISVVIAQFVPRISGLITTELANAVQLRAGAESVVATNPGAFINKAVELYTRVFGLSPDSGGINFTLINSILCVLLLFSIVSMGFGYAQGFLMTRVTTTVAYNLRNSILKKINKLPVGFFHSVSHGEVLSRITNDVDTLSQNLTQSLNQIISTVTTLVMVMTMMFTISWRLTLIALLMIPASALCTLFMVTVSQKYFRAQQKLLGTVNGAVEEVLSGHTVIKAFNGEARVTRDFDKQNDELYNTAWKAQFLTGLMMPMMNLVGNIGYVVVCMYGAYMTTQGIMNVGDIQAFITYIRSFTMPITQLAQISSQLQSTAAAAERVFEFLAETEEVDVDTQYSVRENPITGSVQFEHVRFAYEYTEQDDEEDEFEAMRKKMEERFAKKRGKRGAPPGMPGGAPGGGRGGFSPDDFGFGNKKKVKKLAGYEEEVNEPEKKKSGEPVIHDFSATVQAGQKVAIVGPTGAGKTTMVKLLMRFHEIQGGEIKVDGRNIARYTRGDLRSEFGMVLQDTWLYNGTIMENIRYGKPNATDEEVIRAAEAAQVDHFVRTLPEGYSMVLNEETTNISQGQKQLLTIARAILANSKILILDEATSSVDTRTEVLIQRAMDNLLEGRTSFIIAHRLSTIRNADLILCMRDGDIVEQGNHEQLMAQNGFYAQLYNSQFERVS
jgi:ATP-binding cassette subfamily B protein